MIPESWTLFAVLVGTLLPLTIFLRTARGMLQSRLSLAHPLTKFRLIVAAFAGSMFISSAPAVGYLLFGIENILGEAALTRAGTHYGLIALLLKGAAVLALDFFKPALMSQLMRQPLNYDWPTPAEVIEDLKIVGIAMGLALLAAVS